MHTLQQLQSGKLTGIQRLKLSCGLTAFPREIFDLSDTLEILDLSGNHLKQLPDDFGRLQKLKIAFFSDNDFTELPGVLSQCPLVEMIGFKANKISSIPEQTLPPTLRWLILTNNCLTAIPSTIGRCSRLQKLMLAGNALTELPQEMAGCQNLELIRISANQFSEIPPWLFSLPKLSWLAYASNPCSKLPETDNGLAEIPWNKLTIAEHLGEGASGMISKAQWLGSAGKEVAVKVFKGEVTSDGLPADEMYACMAAGVHENLVRVLGKISSHPEQKQGLVLELIPPAFKNLGGPPNFATCTRDTYPHDAVFSLSELVRITSEMASVATHLHDRGIMHGDFYPHNILTDSNNTLLGDFGAATIYNKDLAHAPAIERLEVRAFGCLLEDILERIDPNETNEKLINAFTRLKQDCMQPEVLQRPGFASICEQIAGFSGICFLPLLPASTTPQEQK